MQRTVLFIRYENHSDIVSCSKDEHFNNTNAEKNQALQGMQQHICDFRIVFILEIFIFL